MLNFISSMLTLAHGVVFFFFWANKFVDQVVHNGLLESA
jgi:hypothetical protein